MARVFFQLPLRRVELPYEQIVEIERESLRTRSIPIWCTTLTHLEVLYWDPPKDGHIVVPLLQHLDALTHLSLNFFDPEVHERVHIVSLLETKPFLQIVLLDIEPTRIPKDHTPIDIRIVYLVESNDPVGAWKGHGPKGSKWVWAEEEVAKRRMREARSREQSEDKV
ncbi:hypothetical protein BKA70DRAFT_1448192 [Coprinopsis sp. MPI-PUGE-AT-0042]|nr:hypothetical protein BKA70DRAFT_1448192 [Coprinopsis sp. MPI-PUGE-AT-0042]